jgi:hypothetical protein
MILYEIIRRKNNMICLVLLDEIHLDDEHDENILVDDFPVLKIYLVEWVDHLEDDELLLIWKIYFEDEDFEDNKVVDNKLKKKNQLI